MERRDSTVRWRFMPVQELRSSSAVERAAYNASNSELSVWFRGGRRYVYSEVPPELYKALCAAASAGRFVNEWIKGRFPCRPERPRGLYRSSGGILR